MAAHYVEVGAYGRLTTDELERHLYCTTGELEDLPPEQQQDIEEMRNAYTNTERGGPGTGESAEGDGTGDGTTE